MFYFGSSYLLAPLFLWAGAWTWSHWLWLVCSPLHPIPPVGCCWEDPTALTPGWQRGDFAGVSAVAVASPLLLPAASLWQPAVAAAGLSRQPSCPGRHALTLRPPAPLPAHVSPRPRPAAAEDE